MIKIFFDQWKKSFSKIIVSESISLSSQKIFILIVLLFCAAIRLWTIGTPALDRTMWKEIDYVQVSSNYWNHGFNFFQPEISWPAEPPRITAMEFPLVPYLTSLLYPIFGFNVYTVRLITLLSFLLIVVYVFRLTKKELGTTIGLISAITAAILPLMHPFNRILFSEPLMIALSLMTIYHFVQWLDHQKKRDWTIAMLSCSLAIAVKLEPLYLYILLFGLYFLKYKFKLLSYKNFIVFVLASLILPALWYTYAYFLSKNALDVFGIFGGQFGGHNKFQTITMLTNVKWYITLLKRVFRHILGGEIGSLLFLVGIITTIYLRKGRLFWMYLFTILFYFGIVAEGQLDAPYRQLTIIPPISGFVAIGALAVSTAAIALIMKIRTSWLENQLLQFVLIVIGSTIFLMLIFMNNFRSILQRDPSAPADTSRWKLAQEMKKYAEDDAKIITAGEYTIHVGGYDFSPVLYYYSGLQGWALQKGEWNLKKVENLIQKGATLFTAVDMWREPEVLPFINSMKNKYLVLYENQGNELLLIDLRLFN